MDNQLYQSNSACFSKDKPKNETKESDENESSEGGVVLLAGDAHGSVNPHLDLVIS